MTAHDHAYHRSIKTTPASVNTDNAEAVWKTLYGATCNAINHVSYKFNAGDTVRISMAARAFRKGYLPRWTTELFTVSARISRQPPVCKFKDYDGRTWTEPFTNKNFNEV